MDIAGFIERNMKVSDKPIVLYPYQKKILSDESDFRIILKSRQIGITQTIAWEALVYALAESNHLILIVSASHSLAKDVMKYISNAYNSLHEDMKLILMVETKEELCFENNSRILSLPNNPRCYDEETEILTENGWKLFKDIDKTEKVAQVNPDTLRMDFVKPNDFINMPYNGDLVEIKNRTVDLLVTPNHRMLLLNYDKKNHRIKNHRVELAGSITQYDNYIPKAVFAYEEKAIESFVLKMDGNGRNKFHFSGDDFCRFMGMYLSEGSYHHNKRNGGYTISIAQYPGWKKDRMRNCLKGVGIRFNETHHAFVMNGKALYEYVKQFGKCRDKYVPKIIKNASKKQMREFLDWFLLGDGSIKNGRHRYSTNSRHLADDIQEMLLRLGMCVNIKEFPYEKGKSSGIMYHIGEQITKRQTYRNIGWFNRRDHVKRKRYDGRIFCVGVPTGFIVVRRNGKAVICGNTVMGRRATRIYIDEYAKFMDDEKMWEAIMPSISRGGKATIISTPMGKRGKFFEFWENAEKQGWSKYEIPWKECPDIASRIELIRKGMPDELSFRQEYETTFIDEAISYFPWELIMSCIDDELLNEVVKDGNPSFTGVDFGKIVDSSVVVHVKKADGIYIIDYIIEFLPPVNLKREVVGFIKRNHKSWGSSRIVVDQTGMGEGVIEELEELGSVVIGQKLTAPFKEKIIANLKAQMMDGKVKMPRNEKLILQLHALQKTITDSGILRYSHPTSGNVQHDDYVWCYDGKSKILTDDGWKYFKELKLNDKIAQLQDNHLIFKEPKKIVSFDYDGDMVRILGKQEDLLITPNHKCLVSKSLGANEYGNFELIEASRLIGKHFRLKKDCEWNGNSLKSIRIKPLNQKFHKRDGFCMKSSDFMEFLGYYLSEGWKNKKHMFIAQIKGDKYKKIKSCLERLPIKFYERKNGFEINSKQLVGMFPNGLAHEKYIPKEYKSLNTKLLRILLDAMMLGDGSDGRLYYTSSKKLAEDFSEIALKCGYGINIGKDDRRGRRAKHGYTNFINYRVSLVSKNEPRINHHVKNQVREVGYYGKVYCCESDTGIIMVMRNGKACWCGNSLALAVNEGSETEISGGAVFLDNPIFRIERKRGEEKGFAEIGNY